MTGRCSAVSLTGGRHEARLAQLPAEMTRLATATALQLLNKLPNFPRHPSTACLAHAQPCSRCFSCCILRFCRAQGAHRPGTQTGCPCRCPRRLSILRLRISSPALLDTRAASASPSTHRPGTQTLLQCRCPRSLSMLRLQGTSPILLGSQTVAAAESLQQADGIMQAAAAS